MKVRPNGAYGFTQCIGSFSECSGRGTKLINTHMLSLMSYLPPVEPRLYLRIYCDVALLIPDLYLTLLTAMTQATLMMMMSSDVTKR